MSSRQCTQVSPLCPVEATVYGYYPNLGANAFYCASFAIFTIAQLVLGIRYKTWTWMIATVVGCAMESIGYGGRIMMHMNPWDGGGFKMQIVCLILAPSLLSASIDLTLKHVVLVFGTAKSRIRPNLYTWVFIGLDVASILIQAVGGAIAASGENNRSLLDVGNNLMLAGIIVQVVQLVAFALVTIDYVVRTRKANEGTSLSPLAAHYAGSKRFKWFAMAVTGAFCGILVRCIYRIPEMAGGWGGAIQRDETSFLVLDGAMIWIAAFLLTVCHPGYCFPQLSKNREQRRQSIGVGEKGTRDQTPSPA